MNFFFSQLPILSHPKILVFPSESPCIDIFCHIEPRGVMYACMDAFFTCMTV